MDKLSISQRADIYAMLKAFVNDGADVTISIKGDGYANDFKIVRGRIKPEDRIHFA